MTYLEIIQWIEDNAISASHSMGWWKVQYLSEGFIETHVGKELVSIVLEINDKELIK